MKAMLYESCARRTLCCLYHRSMRTYCVISVLYSAQTRERRFTQLLPASRGGTVHAVKQFFGGSQAVSTSTHAAWRQAVREAVQAIVNPHVLDWMDDDDSLGEADVISRALQEIDERFERE
ncbi:hypothetical protein C8T65DRAFT_10618 [Cerioporus squamosus]|nr:hypothetical protein C8T65DRAFT_10618 [Cerioporus squamosus]